MRLSMRFGMNPVTCTALSWLLLAVLIAPAFSIGPDILGIRYWTAPDHTRIVLDLTAPADFEVLSVNNPERIAIDLTGARFRSTATIPVGDGLVRRIRRNILRGQVQVVIDLEKEAAYRYFTLPAADGRPDRVVVDVSRPETTKPSHPSPDRVGNERTVLQPQVKRNPDKPFTIILDPGHGGIDPGAVRQGVKEKDVVLPVCREAARLLNRIPGYRAVLTRERDYFLRLSKRVKIAQDQEGDLFLSVHTNTHPKRSTSGMEVYFLTLKGATDREAKELADKENAADLVGLAPDERENDSVITILLDLHMTRILNSSSRLAEHIMDSADQSGVVGTRRVKQARFQVLRSLAMPSALVELAYLSHSGDRKLLGSWQGQKKLAEVLVAGILSYQGDHKALASLPFQANWNQTYKVCRGDSLWKLAQRFGTTVTEIRNQNNLRSSRLLVGQELRLPNLD